jgi:hypothetical protein
MYSMYVIELRNVYSFYMVHWNNNLLLDMLLHLQGRIQDFKLGGRT